MSEQNKALAKRWFEEVWNQGRESTIDELFHPQGKVHGFPEPDSVLIGPAGFKTIHRVFRSAFGSLHIDLDDLIAEADRVAIRWTCTGTHTGGDLGFPAAGKKVVILGSSFIACSGGQITQGWNFMDLTKMTQQLQSG
jgi:steroid delta-isomerase-like uncharacterized protein